MLEFQFWRDVEELRLMESNLRVWNALIDMREFMCVGLALPNGKVKYFEKKICDAGGVLLGRGR